MNSLRGIIRSARRRGEHLSTWPVYTPIWRDASVRRSRNYQSAHLDKFAHLVDRRDGVMVGERHQTAVGSSADSATWAQQTRRELEISWLGPMKRSFSREPYLTLGKRFSRVLGTRHKVSVFKVREIERAIWA